MQWKPYVTVAAIIMQNDQFLLVEEEADGLTVFNQPAGHLEQDETLIQAIKREVLEETTWEFVPESIVGVYLYPNPRVQEITYLRICFYGQCTKEHPDRDLDNGILRAVWLTRDDVLNKHDRMRSPMVMQCIDDFLLGESYPLDLLHHFLSDIPVQGVSPQSQP